MASAANPSSARPAWQAAPDAAPPKQPPEAEPDAKGAGHPRSPAWSPNGPIRRPDGFLQTTTEGGATELVFDMARGKLSLTCYAIGQDAVDKFVSRFVRFVATGIWEGGPAGPFGGAGVGSFGQTGAAAARGFVFSLGLTPEFVVLLLPHWIAVHTGEPEAREAKSGPQAAWASPQLSLLCQRLERLPFGSRTGEINREPRGHGDGKDETPPREKPKARRRSERGFNASLGALQQPPCLGSHPPMSCRVGDQMKPIMRRPGRGDRKRRRDSGSGRRGRDRKKRGRGIGGKWAWGGAGIRGGQKRGLEGGASAGGGRRADARPLSKRRLD